MRRHWLSGLMLVLAATGLFVMHGPDAGSHGGPQLPDPVAMAMPDVEPEHSGAAVHAGAVSLDPAGAEASTHGGWGHVMALCMAVLATAAGQVLRHLLPRARVALVGLAPVATRWRVRWPGTAGPPAPTHLELCVQLC
jgi:hypothetical protein